MKKIVFVCMLLFAVTALFALPAPDETDWNLSIQPFFGLRFGEIGEYVFLRESKYRKDTLSELRWEYKPSVYFGANVQGGWRGIVGTTTMSIAVPGYAGTMYDSDWLNIQYDNESMSSYKTNYTKSKNYSKNSYTVGIGGGYQFKPAKNVNITPLLSFDYSYTSFTAKGATGYYGWTYGATDYLYYGPYYAYNDSRHSPVSTSNSTAVVSYERSSYFVWLGLTGEYVLPRHITLGAAVHIAPYVYTYSVDNHEIRKIKFTDVASDFFAAYKGSLEVGYTWSRRHTIAVSGSFLYLKTLRGNSYDTTNSSKISALSDQDGGADEYYFDIRFSYRFTFF